MKLFDYAAKNKLISNEKTALEIYWMVGNKMNYLLSLNARKAALPYLQNKKRMEVIPCVLRYVLPKI